MKVQYKGVIEKSKDAESSVCKSAVKYIDPESSEMEGRGPAIYSIVALLVPLIVFSIKYLMINETPFVFNILGIVIGCIIAFPHEILHGICFPWGSKVELYQMLRPSRMFVTSETPIKKGRYVFIYLFPNIVLGLVPLLIWLFADPYTYLSKTLFSIGFITIVTGGRDYMNIMKTLKQVPKNAVICLSGIKVYYCKG